MCVEGVGVGGVAECEGSGWSGFVGLEVREGEAVELAVEAVEGWC